MPNSIGKLSGKTILLHIDQGLGDTIQYVRYVPYLIRQGARVVLESPRELATLLAAALPSMSVLVQGEALPPFDCHFPLVSLPAALGNESAAEPPYLEAPPVKSLIGVPRSGLTICLISAWFGRGIPCTKTTGIVPYRSASSCPCWKHPESSSWRFRSSCARARLTPCH